jgi:SAM-dependent methyltransferase
MTFDPTCLVCNGYDHIAEAYLERYGTSTVRDRWTAELMTRLPKPGRARVLDLGCGAGIPVARALTDAGHDVVGVDGSDRQIALARANVPAAEFIRSDMRTVDFPSRSFDAVAAFYSVTHVPRSDHRRLLESIVGWLKPGGVFVASLGATSSRDWQGEWMGVPMIFSHYDAAGNRTLLADAGFVVERTEVVEQDNEDARFLWVVARKPPSP